MPLLRLFDVMLVICTIINFKMLPVISLRSFNIPAEMGQASCFLAAILEMRAVETSELGGHNSGLTWQAQTSIVIDVSLEHGKPAEQQCSLQELTGPK